MGNFFFLDEIKNIILMVFSLWRNSQPVQPPAVWSCWQKGEGCRVVVVVEGGCQAGSLRGEISLFLIRGALEEVSVERSEWRKSLWAIKCFHILMQFQLLLAIFFRWSEKTLIAIKVLGTTRGPKKKKKKSNISSCNLSDWPGNYMVPVISQKWYFICRFASCWMIDAVTWVIRQGSVNWHLL